MAFITDWIRIAGNFNLNIIKITLLQLININDDTQNILHLIRNILHQSLRISNSTHLSIVAYSNIHLTTLCICETANPLQILIPPRLLILYVLVFFHFFNYFLKVIKLFSNHLLHSKKIRNEFLFFMISFLDTLEQSPTYLDLMSVYLGNEY